MTEWLERYGIRLDSGALAYRGDTRYELEFLGEDVAILRIWVRGILQSREIWKKVKK